MTKKRIQDLINQQRTNLADVGYLDLNSVAKILKNIEKSHDKGKKLLDESRSELEDSDVRFCEKEEPQLQTTDENGTHDVIKLTDIDAFTAGAYDKEAVKRNNCENKKSKDYRYEITEIELMEGTHGDDNNGELPRSGNNSISTAKILKNNEKSYDKWEKLLDKSSSKLEDSYVRFRGDDEPVFYSSARRAVENIKQERSTPEQWLKMIEKIGGYKKSPPSRLGELFVFLVG